jgi:hypothetical protein
MSTSMSTSGSFDRTLKFLSKMQSSDLYSGLEALAQKGVAALQSATPVDSGLASESWSYEIVRSPYGASISWVNTDRESGAKVVILIQYGHASKDGTFVSGRDFINPAIQPIFDEIANETWKKVTSA